MAQPTEGQVITVDGKMAGGSRDRNLNQNSLPMVSAGASDNRPVFGPEAVDDQSNESTAIPKLLALLELTGCIVTIDARGCQREIASQISEPGGD